jgi:hypothetical protein
MDPPFIPVLNHEEDLSHFEANFTKLPLESPPVHSSDFPQSEAFKGFSFVASSEFLKSLDRS